MFIDDSEIFANDDVSADDKKFILDLIDKTDFSFETKIHDQNYNAATVDYNIYDDATTSDYNMKTNDLDDAATVDYNN